MGNIEESLVTLSHSDGDQCTGWEPGQPPLLSLPATEDVGALACWLYTPTVCVQGMVASWGSHMSVRVPGMAGMPLECGHATAVVVASHGGMLHEVMWKATPVAC